MTDEDKTFRGSLVFDKFENLMTPRELTGWSMRTMLE